MEKKEVSREAEHTRKIIAPVVIAVLLGVYYIAIGVAFLCIPGVPVLLKFLAAVIPAALAGVILFVLMERIEEIRSGEEDDLSKY